MTTNRALRFLPCGLMVFALTTACSEGNDDDYNSVIPTFSDITFENLTRPNDSLIYEGDTIVATAVQSRKGYLLGKTTYSWKCSCSGSTSACSHHYTGASSILGYDSYNSNPFDTIAVGQGSSSGYSHALTLNATYSVSGNGIKDTPSAVTTNDFTATYSTSLLTFKATVTKTYKVYSK